MTNKYTQCSELSPGNRVRWMGCLLLVLPTPPFSPSRTSLNILGLRLPAGAEKERKEKKHGVSVALASCMELARPTGLSILGMPARCLSIPFSLSPPGMSHFPPAD